MPKYLPWLLWALLALVMTVYLTSRMRGPDQRVFLPGDTSHGHYQIELSCGACHTPMMGVKEEACYQCHESELTLARDSHPKSKFTDPRNADRVAKLDARNCITCHREHQPRLTRAMGVTLPTDFCFNCHEEIANDRPSHAGLGFDTCSTAGCHNYHDNTALYEDFLAAHLDEPDVNHGGRLPDRASLVALVTESTTEPPTPDVSDPGAADHRITDEWLASAHALNHVNCSDCHQPDAGSGAVSLWSDTVSHETCATCHEWETSGFLEGRHGMRLAADLSPMTPGMARLPMHAEAAHRELSCSSCHDAHDYNTRSAAVESCLSCHDDDHSRAYRDSAHFGLWLAETEGDAMPGSGVSCATCHLPRETARVDGREVVRVQHNQNFNLRPNEKMIRGVCLQCHGLGFTLDALADRELILRNFDGRPQNHVESLDWVADRLSKTPNNNPENKP